MSKFCMNYTLLVASNSDSFNLRFMTSLEYIFSIVDLSPCVRQLGGARNQ